jgi:biopolymer transport protein ExbB
MPDKVDMWLQGGGLTMVPIVLASVLGLGIAIERALTLRRSRVLPDALVTSVFSLVAVGHLAEAERACAISQTPAARVCAAVLRCRDRRRPVLRATLDDAGRVEASALDAGIELLGTIASVTPLLGLLGTVLGMIEAFQLVAAHGFGEPARFASGIWQALITTAAGLIVAVPAFVTYRVLVGRLETRLTELEAVGVRLVEVLATDGDPP